MLTSLRLQASHPPFGSLTQKVFAGNADARCKLLIRSRPIQRFSSLTLQTPSDAAACEPQDYTSTVGSSSVSSSQQLSQWNLNQRHITILNVIACLTAISATWVFCSAIPALLALKRAAESLEKLMDVTRDELPETMAAIRLSGMEISDLTMELSDLGLEITQGVKNSTRAVRVAEEGIRRLTNMAPTASLQTVTTPKSESGGPVVARTARSMREGIVQGRAIWQMFFSLTRFSRFVFNYVIRRRKS